MDDPREVPRPVTGLSTQWQDEDLKAQDDLLSLKVLQDPGFLHRVPTLIPGKVSEATIEPTTISFCCGTGHLPWLNDHPTSFSRTSKLFLQSAPYNKTVFF